MVVLDYRYVLIKKYRKEKEYSLESLSHGICSVSYLSKIENNEIHASNEILNLLLNKLDISLLEPQEEDKVKKLLDQFFESMFAYNTKVYEISKQLQIYKDQVKTSSVYIYYQLYLLFAQKLELVELKEAIDIESYLVFMNEKEMRLYQIFKEWTEDKNLKEDSVQLFLLKSKATHAFLNHDVFKAYDLLKQAYTFALQECNIICACDVLLDLGWICFPNVAQVMSYYEKVLDISKRYLHQSERSVYASIVYNNLTTLYFINEQYDQTKKYFKKGIKFIKDEVFLKRLELFEKLMNNQYHFDSNWYEEIKEELNTYPHDLFFHYAFKKVCVVSSHWKEAYEQEVYFSTKQYLGQTEA